MASARSTNQLENLKRLKHENLALQQRIDFLEMPVETVIIPPEFPQTTKHEKVKNHAIAIDPVLTYPQGQPQKKNICMTELNFAFSLLAKPSTTAYTSSYRRLLRRNRRLSCAILTRTIWSVSLQ